MYYKPEDGLMAENAVCKPLGIARELFDAIRLPDKGMYDVGEALAGDIIYDKTSSSSPYVFAHLRF